MPGGWAIETATVVGERRAVAKYRASLAERLPYPIRTVLRRWRGLVGMMIGVGISLGIVMTLSGIGQAVIDVYTADYIRSGVDLYVVTQGGTLIPVLPSDTPGTIKDARQRLSQIRGMPDVNAAIGMMAGTLDRERDAPRRRDEPKELWATVGVDGDPTLISDALAMREGRWLRRSDEVVLGPKLSHETGLKVGDSLRLNGRDLLVVGIGRLRGSGGFNSDSVAYVDAQTLRQRADLGDLVNIIAVDTARPEENRTRVEAIGSLSAYTASDLVKQARERMGSRLITYYILDALALAIGALFVANMLGRSVAERRLEFATLRAIGISSRTILLTVAYEAILISLLAGVLGVMLSLFLGWLINNFLAPSVGVESLYSADAWLFMQVFLVALVLGLVAGLFPARAATRVDPVEVLREA